MHFDGIVDEMLADFKLYRVTRRLTHPNENGSVKEFFATVSARDEKSARLEADDLAKTLNRLVEVVLVEHRNGQH